ncbi:hypothetical protein BDW22DRAFT_1357982 [Trametopsis cervina]|nr:hypothetical protein BDW22DRAFT_1357982 [Trametopsis cervina]
MPVTPSTAVQFASESEQASLHGQRALTPILAGSISGGLVGVAWIVGFIIYFYKRHRREKRARALGFRSHREMLDPPKKKEAFIIPPDPAIVEGDVEPGAKIYDDPKLQGSEMPQHARTEPITQTDHDSAGSSTLKEAEGLDTVPEIPHSTSAPNAIPQSSIPSTSHHPSDSPTHSRPPVTHHKRSLDIPQGS